MAVGRFGVGPRVVLTVVATVVLTGVVTAVGRAFASDPAPTSTTAPTTTTTEKPTTTTEKPSDQADRFAEFVKCYGGAQGATAELSTVTRQGESLTKVELETSDVRSGCQDSIVICMTDRPYLLPDPYPKPRTIVPELDASIQIAVTTDKVGELATLRMMAELQGQPVDVQLEFRDTVDCDRGPNDADPPTPVPGGPAPPVQNLPSQVVPSDRPEGSDGSGQTPAGEPRDPADQGDQPTQDGSDAGTDTEQPSSPTNVDEDPGGGKP